MVKTTNKPTAHSAILLGVKFSSTQQEKPSQTTGRIGNSARTFGALSRNSWCLGPRVRVEERVLRSKMSQISKWKIYVKAYIEMEKMISETW